ncbi:MAG TPA: ABC-2 family transporter protein [Gemmataceae bacterium]|nr:ABC-2 family transporter protein [Gemmataceae bacterium]
MSGPIRYFRIYLALARYGLARELAFRGNFVVKMIVEVLWLSIVLAFYETVFTKTSVVASWTRTEYLFFIGCYFTLLALIEALFLSNCSEFAELVRTGDLDFYLLKPIDEQFLVTCRDIDWSCVANVAMGIVVMIIALLHLEWTFDVLRVLAFGTLFVCGIAIAYSLLVCLMSMSVWLKRNQSLYELWWLFTSLARYPKEIFSGRFAGPLGKFFTWIIPVLVVVNVPARVMIRKLEDPWLIAFTVPVAVVLLFASRKFFRYALRRYRSASS